MPRRKKKSSCTFLEGEVDAWIDGVVSRDAARDLAAFPAGTGICHCFINNSEQDALLMVEERPHGPTIASTTRSILNAGMTCLERMVGGCTEAPLGTT